MRFTLVLGPLEWFAIGAPVLAIVLGAVALHRIRRAEGALTGRGLAIAGITVAVSEIVAGVVLIALALSALSHLDG